MKKVPFLVTLVLLWTMMIPVIPTTGSITVQNQTKIVTFSPQPDQAAGFEIVNPEDGVTLGDTVTIHASVDDSTYDPTTMKIYINDTLVATGPDYYYWDADTFPEGPVEIKVTVENTSGTEFEDTHTVTVDHAYETGVVSVMNYNIGEGGRYGDFWEVIEKWGLDIILMVETGAFPGDDNEQMQAWITEWNAAWPNRAPYDYYKIAYEGAGPGATASQSILSRYPIVEFNELRNLPMDDGSIATVGHILLHAVVEIGETYVHFFTFHYNCCDGGQSNRERDAEAFINYYDTLGPDAPIALIGDFNSHSPEDEQFRYSKNLGTDPLEFHFNTDHEHASIYHNWTDVYRDFHPYTFGPTFTDAVFSSRLDYNVVNDFFFDKTINTTLDDSDFAAIRSDHFPINSWFNFDAPEIDLTPPIMVKLEVDTFSDSSVTLKWSASPSVDVEEYELYRDDVLIANLTNTTLMYVDNTITANTDYEYKIRGTDATDNIGDFSPLLLFNSNRGELTYPNPPTNLDWTFDEVARQLTITWDAPDDGGLPITGYQFFRTNLGGMAIDRWTLVETVTTTSATIDVNPGATLVYSVKAINAIDISDRSEPLIVDVPEVSTTPTDSEGDGDGDSPLNIFGVTLAIILLPMTMKKLKKLKR